MPTPTITPTNTPTPTPTLVEIVDVVSESSFDLIEGLSYIKNNDSYRDIRNKINGNFEFMKNFIQQQLNT